MLQFQPGHDSGVVVLFLRVQSLTALVDPVYAILFSIYAMQVLSVVFLES